MSKRQHTVLIIDDSEDEILLTRRLLARIFPQIRVEAALSGREGLEKLRNGGSRPVLIMLDLKMTCLSGIDTLRQIRADTHLQHLTVAIVTNSKLDSDRQEAMEAGADVFLHKDFDLEFFSKELQDLLGKILHSLPAAI